MTKEKLIADLKKTFGQDVHVSVALMSAHRYNATHPRIVPKTRRMSTDVGNSNEPPKPRSLGEILTPEEVAERLKVPAAWVYEKTRARCKNPIPSIAMGRYIRFDWNEVVHWLEAQSSSRPAARPVVVRRKQAV